MYLLKKERKIVRKRKTSLTTSFIGVRLPGKTLCESRAVSGQSVSTPPSSLSSISGIPNFSWPKETFGGWF